VTETSSDIGKATIKVRKVTSWQPNWSASGSGEQGTYVFQLILDDGAAEAVLVLTPDDADNLFDWLSASSQVHYDMDREVLIFGTRPTGS
jgi:hypothetical protein